MLCEFISPAREITNVFINHFNFFYGKFCVRFFFFLVAFFGIRDFSHNITDMHKYRGSPRTGI